MSVGGIRSPSISGTDSTDLAEQEYEQSLYNSAMTNGTSSTDDPNDPDNDPNDPSQATSSINTAAISVGQDATPNASATGEISRASATESLKSTLSADDRVSEPAPARSQATQKVTGMRGGADPMLAVYEMESQRDTASVEPNIVRSKDNVG